MRSIYSCACLAGLALCFTGPAAGQSILEHATAAAGGSAAGVAAGPISEGVGLIFRKLDKQGKRAAAVKTATKKKEKQETRHPAAPTAKKATAFPAPRFHPANAARKHRLSARRSRPEGRVPLVSPGWTATIRLPRPPRITKKDLASVAKGTSRKELLAHLGPPSARVLIPEDGQLREIYSFAGGRKHLGWVRLVNGAVNSVKLDPES